MNMNLIAQAQKMQRDIQKKQEEIYASDFIGESELVDIEMTGDKKVKRVVIKNKESIDKEDLEVLEDMIMIAFNNGLSQIDTEIEKKLGSYSKSLGGLF